MIDGDTLEKKNLDRQLFAPADVGSNKAEALCMVIGCANWHPHYFSFGCMGGIGQNDWLFCCADNHPCRKAVLETCDMEHCKAIIACNETTSAEAFYYQPSWQGSHRDPRVYYPEINTDHAGDPMAAAIGCTGVAQEQNRQLVSANFMAASLAQWLYVLWGMEYRKLDREITPKLPYRLTANMSNLLVERVGE